MEIKYVNNPVYHKNGKTLEQIIKDTKANRIALRNIFGEITDLIDVKDLTRWQLDTIPDSTQWEHRNSYIYLDSYLF